MSKKKSEDAKYKNPEGGMKNISEYNKEHGTNLKPGVKGPADTPEEMRRKSSFLLRHYKGEFNQDKPLVDDKGEPTRHALQAKAWGEPTPKNKEDVKKLVQKGEKLAEKYKKKKESK